MWSRRSPTGQGGEGGHGEDGNDDDDNNEEDEDGDPVSEEYVQVKAATEPSSSSALVQLNRMKKEKVLVGIISKQIQEAGGCRMLVKVRRENSLLSLRSPILRYLPLSLPSLRNWNCMWILLQVITTTPQLSTLTLL